MLRRSDVQRRARQGTENNDHSSLRSKLESTTSSESEAEHESLLSHNDKPVRETITPESLGLSPLEEESPLAPTDRFIRARTESILDESDTPVRLFGISHSVTISSS